MNNQTELVLVQCKTCIDYVALTNDHQYDSEEFDLNSGFCQKTKEPVKACCYCRFWKPKLRLERAYYERHQGGVQP